MSKQQILLDMDGVLSDFLSGALVVLNMKYDRNHTIDSYARSYGQWNTFDFYGISEEDFWSTIERHRRFWINLNPIPWADKLYKELKKLGDVTIVTSPSLDYDCASQKLEWLDKHLGVKSNEVFIGSRKYLMAGNGILIDDNKGNCDKFIEAGGESILVPSNWNTVGLTFQDVMDKIYGRI